MPAQLWTSLSSAQRLALAYAPARARPRFAGLFTLDRLLGQALAQTREPLAAQLRLAWWRDTLADPASPLPDPRLTSLRGGTALPGSLEAMVDGWELLLAEVPDLAAAVGKRAEPYGALADDLGCSAAGVAASRAAAERWLMVDLAGHLSNPALREQALEFARAMPPPGGLPRVMRPLAVLGGLASRAVARGGALIGDRWSPLAAMRLGIFGR